jgi:hypothetical protein
MKPFAEHLRHLSIVAPRMGGTVDASVAAQVRTHPTVDQVIPAIHVPIRVSVPPLGVWMISIYGVSESELQTLTSLYGVQMKEGHLPRPRTNEVALSEAVALNRDLSVGDRIGRSVDGHEYNIPAEMIVTGIFSQHSQGHGANDLWLGFASYEYLSRHELYASHPIDLLVIPAEGHKDEMDTWLQENVRSDLAGVRTFERLQNTYRQQTLTALAVFGVVESIIAIVAAMALAVLSYTFFTQRKEEFGILHAMGRSRWWLVCRTAKETASVVAVAWLIGAVVCAAGLIYAQFNLYTPKGLSLNFFDLTPWLFTLPLPLAVIVVSSGLVSRMLRKLDPVSIVERRA